MPEVERRTKVLKARLSEAEHAALVARSTRPQLAEWVRGRVSVRLILQA